MPKENKNVWSDRPTWEVYPREEELPFDPRGPAHWCASDGKRRIYSPDNWQTWYRDRDYSTPFPNDEFAKEQKPTRPKPKP